MIAAIAANKAHNSKELAGSDPREAARRRLPSKNTASLQAFSPYRDNVSISDKDPYPQREAGQMPNAARRDTWTDWFPDANEKEQVTLDELITQWVEPRLGDGEEVSPDTVRYWQRVGVLPQPVKRWHEGATRALYPAPYAFLAIFAVLDLQDMGFTLQQIGGRLRRRFKSWSIRSDDPREWRETALRMASEYTEITGTPLTHVQIRFIIDEVEEDIFSYPVSSKDYGS